MKKKASWWVCIGRFLDRIWAILQHAVFSYTHGDNNKTVNITGEQVSIDGPKITITFEHPVFLNEKGIELLTRRIDKELNKQAWLSVYFAEKNLDRATRKLHKDRKEVNDALHLLDDDSDAAGGMRNPPTGGEQGEGHL